MICALVWLNSGLLSFLYFLFIINLGSGTFLFVGFDLCVCYWLNFGVLVVRFCLSCYIVIWGCLYLVVTCLRLF